jgi:hypothetical protein
MAFTIDKIRRVTAYAAAPRSAAENHGVEIKKDDILYTIKDVTGFSISNGGETVDAVDGSGNIIEAYLRSKTAEMSGENAIFDMPLAAAMSGTKIAKGSVDISFHDIIKVAKDAKEATLTKTPKVAPTVVYVVNGDGTLGEALAVSAEGDVKYTENKLTFTTSPAIENDVNIFVPYVYAEENAMKFENFADAASIPSRVVVEGLGRDICSHNQVYFYITAPYAELSYDNEFGFETDGTYSFTINCKKPYCSEDGLYSVIVVGAE